MLDSMQAHGNLLPDERRAIEKTISSGEQYGFGNLMSWLATAWALRLRDGHGLPEKVAIEAVSGRTPYPLPPNIPHQRLVRRLDVTGKKVIIKGLGYLCEKTDDTFRTMKGLDIKTGDTVICDDVELLVTNYMEDQYGGIFETRPKAA
jgi:hypothetical protein